MRYPPFLYPFIRSELVPVPGGKSVGSWALQLERDLNGGKENPEAAKCRAEFEQFIDGFIDEHGAPPAATVRERLKKGISLEQALAQDTVDDGCDDVDAPRG